MISADDITGLVLAGGRGVRMGHADKGLMPFRGMALVRHAMAHLSPQVSTLMMSANRNAEIYRTFGVPVYADEMQGHAGPLAGVQTGLAHCTTPYLATVPCDSPFLPHDLVSRLAHALITEDADAAVVRTVEDGRFRLQPVFCLMKSSLLPPLTAFLQRGERKVEAWHDTLKIAKANFIEADAFRNINTPEDLRNFETT